MPISQREKSWKILELENDLKGVVVRSLDPSWKTSLEQQSRQELRFIRELLTTNVKQERRSKVREQCIKMYMTNLGEASILQRRIVLMQELRRWFLEQQKGLDTIADVYDDSILCVLKFLAKSMGFFHPGDVLNRFTTLSSLSKDGMKEQELLHERYIRTHEEHSLILAKHGKRNLLLNNKRFELDEILYSLQKEIRDLNSKLRTSLKLSNDSSRMIFQITSQIHNLHDKITRHRGFHSLATTPAEKLEEIKVRLDVMGNAMKAMVDRQHREQQNQRRHNRQQSFSSHEFNNNKPDVNKNSTSRAHNDDPASKDNGMKETGLSSCDSKDIVSRSATATTTAIIEDEGDFDKCDNACRWEHNVFAKRSLNHATASDHSSSSGGKSTKQLAPVAPLSAREGSQTFRRGNRKVRGGRETVLGSYEPAPPLMTDNFFI